MTILVTTCGLSPQIDAEIDRLERLLADLRRIREGVAPDTGDFGTAPVIHDYGIGVRRVPCLVGHVTGHPNLRGPLSITSDLWVFAPELGWARTLSRYYVLGKPVDSRDRVQ